MTVDERFEQLERKTQRLEQRNKHLTIALTMTAVAMAAVVTMAATGEKYSHFDTITARAIFVTNETGVLVGLSADDDGNGMVKTHSAKGKPLVSLSSTESGKGSVQTFQPNGIALVELGANPNGGGVWVTNKTGESIVELRADEYGHGMVRVYNKTGEDIAQMYADDYGNDVIGAWNRKGKGRTLEPGP